MVDMRGFEIIRSLLRNLPGERCFLCSRHAGLSQKHESILTMCGSKLQVMIE